MKATRIDQYTARVDIDDLKRNDVVLEQLRSALDILVDKYVANRGSKHQFITCITPGPGKTPYYWNNAIHAQEFAQKFGSKLVLLEKSNESN